ncbi:MAG: tRNA uridine-5-carboxymethylaminomethyl(34) synthesis enzyme MnmG [bacterium]
MNVYDVIVVGGGHAGCEASLASARKNKKTILITGNINMIASLPCNPSIGGPAKGIVVREIDALGGQQGKNADLTQIQTKMLNSSKGPAVRALRMQADKVDYPKQMQETLLKTKNLTVLEGLVESLIIENNIVIGVELNNKKQIKGTKVILTTGTYLSSKVLQGSNIKDEGPDDEPTTYGISNQLKQLGFEVLRLKTGTPARIKQDSIDYTKAEIQPGDTKVNYYSFDNDTFVERPNTPCHLIYTNEEIHQVIEDNIKKSAMYGGHIEGVGPRYCPSIEDKVVRFRDKIRHQIFLEPESVHLNQIYIQGYSTSMPVDIQDKMLRMLPGLENCEVIKYAYAIEYDAINPTQLYPSLETKLIKNLYCAGQINGTSGYEEAACQGLMAGINASLDLEGKEPLVLGRNEAYIGVLIDDLVTKGTKEPYRLLTSRAEYRLLLRHDNAHLRLREYGYQVGLINEKQLKEILDKKQDIKDCIEWMKKYKISLTINPLLETINSAQLKDGTYLFELIKRPEVTANVVYENITQEYSLDTLMLAEVEIKYEGYITKATKDANKMINSDNKKISPNINYDDIKNLALEAREKLKKIKPTTLGQAMRISGVNPADIAILSVYIQSYKGE